MVITAVIATYALDLCTNKNSTGVNPVKVETTFVKADMTLIENQPLQTIGGSIHVPDLTDSNYPIIVYRASATQVNAFSSKCTHQGWVVDYVGSDGTARCEKHYAKFEGEGKVVQNPEGTTIPDLLSYNATLESDGKTITIVV